MYFKKWMCGLMAVSLALSGCGLKTGEKAPATSPPSFSGKGYSCVGQIPYHLERYAADELSDEQITDFVRCLQRAFTSFIQLTRGKEVAAYTPDEIRRFLQTYFLKERPITDVLMNEFMVLKQVMVGGTLDKITRGEIQVLIEFLEDLRGEAIRLKPHLKYLNLRLLAGQDPQEIGPHLNEAKETLRTSIRVVTQRFQSGHRSYPFQNLATLLTEFRSFVRWDEYFVRPHAAESWVNFFTIFKEVTVSPVEPDRIRTSDWAPLLHSLSRWYLAYVQYRVGVEGQPTLYGVGLQNTLHFAQELFELTEDAVHRQKNKALAADQINALVKAGQELSWIPERIRQKSVERLVQSLTDRIFADDKAMAHHSKIGVDLPTLALMKYEFYRWAYIQMQLDSRFNGEERAMATAAANVPNLQSNFFIPADVRAKLRNLRDADWEHFLKVKTLARPLFNDNLNRVTLVGEMDLKRFNLFHEFHNLSMMNVLRSAVGMLFRGYAETPNRRVDWNTGLKSEQLQAFYEDVRDMAIDLGLADERVVNTGSRAFIEGNLFTYSADGVDFDTSKSRLTFVETMELLAFLYSGGKTSNDFYRQLKASCTLGPLDLNNDPMIERGCTQQKMAGLIDNFGVNMPGLNSYLQQAPTAERDLLVKNILDSAFSPKHSRVEWVERNELSIAAVVLHYLEAVMTRFDVNRDGILSSEELRVAVPIFVGFIQKFAKDRMKKDLSIRQAEGVFLYILAYRSVPTNWNLLRVYRLAYDFQWEFDFGYGYKFKMDFNQPVSLNRSELSSVFRVIVAKLFDTAPVEEQFMLMNSEPTPEFCQNSEQALKGVCQLPFTPHGNLKALPSP